MTRTRTKKKTTDEQQVSMELVFKDPKTLTPYPDNSKVHPVEQIKAIGESMAVVGGNRTVIVDDNDVVLAGHGTRLAYMYNFENGVTFTRDDGTVEDFSLLPVVIRRGLNEQQKRAYVIADNKMAELSLWDDDILDEQLDLLENNGFDLKYVGLTEDMGLEPPEMEREEAELPLSPVVEPYYRITVELPSEDAQRALHAELIRMGHECKLTIG